MNCILHSTYLVNIFATLNNLNLNMQECNHYSIVFHSSSNVFKFTLKWWCIYQKHGVSLHTQWTFIGEEPVPILGKNGGGKSCTLVLIFPKPLNPPFRMPSSQLKSSMLILKMCYLYLIFICAITNCAIFTGTPPVPDYFSTKFWASLWTFIGDWSTLTVFLWATSQRERAKFFTWYVTNCNALLKSF